MKTKDNSSYLEKLIYLAVEKEKQPLSGDDSRVDLIMNQVNELAIQTRFEVQGFSTKLAFIYGLSIAASVLVGCIIGNMASTSVNALQVSTDTFDLVNIGFNSLVLPF